MIFYTWYLRIITYQQYMSACFYTLSSTCIFLNLLSHCLAHVLQNQVILLVWPLFLCSQPDFRLLQRSVLT